MRYTIQILLTAFLIMMASCQNSGTEPVGGSDAELIQAIIDADEPMAIRLYITSDLITSERMANSTRDGFVRSTDGNIAPIEDKIEELIKAFKDDIEEGDVFDLVYTPEAGVTVYKDGDVESSVQGLAFKKALFGIWLSDNPIQKSLRKALVNR